ncbi:MAG: hypothetical protein JW839_03390 [Candidatus Lokiarchaeota archaeon]|nr:hypothetical protein [Candidatus Lokiarchaeota archaeon]
MNYDEFKKMWDKEGKTEAGAIKCLLVAVLETFKENNADGKRMWGLVLPKDQLTPKGEPGSQHKTALSQFEKTVPGTDFKGGIAASYLGGTPANKYKSDYKASITLLPSSKRGEKESKVFVQSGGKDNPSPVQLRKNDEGYWKIFEYSSLYTGVKPIKSGDF